MPEQKEGDNKTKVAWTHILMQDQSCPVCCQKVLCTVCDLSHWPIDHFSRHLLGHRTGQLWSVGIDWQ